MKFLLEIELGNDGMQYMGDVTAEMAAVTAVLGSLDAFTAPEELDVYDRKGLIRDRNGNLVGKWEIIDDTPTQAERDAAAKRLAEVIDMPASTTLAGTPRLADPAPVYNETGREAKAEKLTIWEHH